MTTADLALYVAAASMVLAAGSIILSGMSLAAWRRESKRNDQQDNFMHGYAGWMSNMQETVDRVDKQSRRIVSHLESDRRTRADSTAHMYDMMDRVAKATGVPEPDRVRWKSSTLPVLTEMQRDVEP